MRIAVITHALDRRLPGKWSRLFLLSPHIYQLSLILEAAEALGWRWFQTDPAQRFRPADAAILHVDQTVIAEPYLALAARYPCAINGRVGDISKRQVSHNLLQRGTDWAGPVMVKSNLNAAGGPERYLARKAAGRAAAPGPLAADQPYRVLRHVSLVPDAVWQDPQRVVERFLPERKDDQFVVRIWSFLGRYERCSWYAAAGPVVKAGSIRSHGKADVPEALRAERERLGFDYGKFDFAEPASGPVLFDANRTPGFLRARPELMRAEAPAMARAMIDLILARRQAPAGR